MKRPRSVLVLLLLTTAMATLGHKAAFAQPASHDRWQWTVTPTAGATGTKVTFTGRLPRELRTDRADQLLLTLSGDVPAPGDPECYFSVDLLDVQVSLNHQTGATTGSFVVGNSGSCVRPPSGDRHRDVPPGRYSIAFGCPTCIVGEFRVQDASMLPFTGSGSLGMGAAGASCIAAGAVLAIAARRRASRWHGNRGSGRTDAAQQ